MNPLLRIGFVTFMMVVVSPIEPIARRAALFAADADVRSAPQSSSNARVQPSVPPLVLTGAWLIDGSGAPVRDNAWVRIEGGRIADVGTGAPPSAKNARVIDLKGKTILPGLSDMHVHVGELVQARWMLKLLLAHGVTTVRDTGNTLGNIAAVRRWIATQDAVPHFYTSGIVFPGGEMEANLELMKAGPQLQAMLEDEAALGIDFVKFHNWISYDALKQIAAFCKEHQLDLIGHIPVNITSLAALDAGMTGLEHIRLRSWEVIDDPEVIARYPIDIYVRHRELFWASFDPNGRNVKNTLDGWAKRKDRFFFDPTLVIGEGGAHFYDPAFDQLPERRYVSPVIDEQWNRSPIRRERLTPEQYAEAKRAHAGHLAFMRLVHGRSIQVLTGTDTPIPYIIPGVSLLRELELLNEAGYSPVEAIQASTGMAARALRRTDRGIIAPQQEADLVIARGNVAADIHAVRQIEQVMVGGRLFERAALLDEATRLAQEQQLRPHNKSE